MLNLRYNATQMILDTEEWELGKLNAVTDTFSVFRFLFKKLWKKNIQKTRQKIIPIPWKSLKITVGAVKVY